MYIAMASLLLVPCLLARRGSGSRGTWLGGGGVFLLVFTLGTTFALFGGEQARVPVGAFHAMTEMLIGVRIWTFIGALGCWLLFSNFFFCFASIIATIIATRPIPHPI